MTDTQPKINITAEPQMRPDQCLFRYDRTLFAGTLYTSDADFAEQWAPLAKVIFDQGNVKGVRIRHAEVLVTAAAKPDDWRDLARSIGAATRSHLQDGGEAVKDGALSELGGNDLLRHRAQEVIDARLNPALAAHGGWVEILDSDGKDLSINMGGGCQGCGSAAATMRQGVEVAIREAVPEIGSILDATDHASGMNPYM